jgi:hypothetical protein
MHLAHAHAHQQLFAPYVLSASRIIEEKDEAKIHIRKLKQKYHLVDQGHYLKGNSFNVTVYWNHMPKVGSLFSKSRTFTLGSFPDSYF